MLYALRNWLVVLVVLPFLIHIISLIIGLCILIVERLNSIVVVGYIRLMQQQGPLVVVGGIGGGIVSIVSLYVE